MKSQFAHLKPQAIQLRQDGNSFAEINTKLGIPNSTLSAWLKDIVLTPTQQKELKARRDKALSEARTKAAEWHRNAKNQRVRALKEKVDTDYASVDMKSNTVMELALAMLYLGEGTKGAGGLGIGNSDPKIIAFYVHAIFTLYGVKPSSLGADLHLRADQDEGALKQFWSEITGIPISKFTYVYKDQRTVGRTTYPNYKGVCSVYGGGVEIQRRLMYLAEVFCGKSLGD